MASLEGRKAPAFELDGSDGIKHALNDYAGKTMIIYLSQGQYPGMHQRGMWVPGSA
jgi:peroxiredoxin